jgi:hypothetical protein
MTTKLPTVQNRYQMAKIYTKWPKYIPNGHSIFQMNRNYTKIFHSKALKNIPELIFFGMKIYHLATLWSCVLYTNILL